MSCHGRGDMIAGLIHIRNRIISARLGVQLSLICEQTSLLHDNDSRQGDRFLPVTPPLQLSLISNAEEKNDFALSAAEDQMYEQ